MQTLIDDDHRHVSVVVGWAVTGRPLRGEAEGGSWRSAVLDALLPYGSVGNFRRGRQIFRQGGSADYWYWLAPGAVQVCCFAEDGRRHVEEFVLGGDFSGLEASETQSATAEAARDATVMAFSRTRVEALVDANPLLARAFRNIACRRLQEAQARLRRLGRTSVLELVASLLDMAERCRIAADQVVEIPLTRDDVADYLGLKSETVSRTLTELHHRGAIALPARRSILLFDRAALAAVQEAWR